jgi:hypothetical protein
VVEITMKLVKLFFIALLAWALGIAFIATTLYLSNGGVDFTVTDLMGFGVMAVVASGLLMLVLYLPSLYWLKPRTSFMLLTGVVCNLPVFITLLLMVNRKMVPGEALGFIATFLIIGSVFGFGFTLVHHQRHAGNR